MDLRIVATTNAGHLGRKDAIDEAILRPGRLCRQIHIGLLSPDHAAMLYTKLTGKDDRTFDRATSLADVYRVSRDNGYVPPKHKQGMGFVMDNSMGGLLDDDY